MDDPRPTTDSLLTLTEAAAHTGHTREALRQRVKRGSLQSVKGNDGQVRVHLRDLGDLPPPDETGVDPGQVGDTATDATLIVLVATVADLRTDLGHARSTLDKAVADHLVNLGQAQERAAQAITERDQARQEREDARVRAARAEGTASALREALAEAQRPFWRRWLG